MPVCPRCRRADRVSELSTGGHWCDYCCGVVESFTLPAIAGPAADAPAPTSLLTGQPKRYLDWSVSQSFGLTLADGTEVEAHYHASEQLLRLHGPFGAAVRRPFVQVDGASLESCALAAAESVAVEHKRRSLAGEAATAPRRKAAQPIGRLKREEH